MRKGNEEKAKGISEERRKLVSKWFSNLKL